MSRRPALIGHSHSETVFAAARAAGRPLDGYNFWCCPQPPFDAERTAFHPEIAATLRDRPVVSMVGGATHNVLGLVRHPVAFDFALPGCDRFPSDPEALAIPADAVAATMLHHLDEYHAIIALVRATATGPVFHVAPPPPLADDARVLADIPWMFFPDLTREVSPAPLRYKLWRLAARLTAAFCAARDIAVIAPPREAVGEDGFLRPEFYGDAMHVNEAYGALVLAQIEALA